MITRKKKCLNKNFQNIFETAITVHIVTTVVQTNIIFVINKYF